MLTPKATRSKLMGVYGRIIRWRLDIDKLDPREQLLLSLTGYAHEAEPLAQNEKPGDYINSRVDRLLFDKDLLNCDLNLETVPVEQKGILVLGEPAAGKTTLLKFLELEAARRALGDPTALVPVRIELGPLKTGTRQELLDEIEHIARRGPEDKTGEFVLPPSHKYLLLIDALDEAPNTQTAAQACIELAQDERIGRIVVTSRIINYDVLLRRSDSNLAKHGFRTCLYYGHSPAGVEQRVLMGPQSEHRQNLLDMLGSSKKRAVWLQYFRLPAHFEFASEFLLDADPGELESPNRFRLLESYLGSLMEKRDWAGPRPSQAEVDPLLSQIAGYVFQTSSRSFSKVQIREAMKKGPEAEIDDKEMEKIVHLLTFATKVGIIEVIPDGYRFRHAQYIDICRPLRSGLENHSNRRLATKRFGSVKRMLDLAKQHAAQPIPQASPRSANDYVVELAIQCINSGPLREEPEMTEIRKELEHLSKVQN